MLTLQEILKASRMLEQTGEPRPGYLHDGADNLEGQGTVAQGALVSDGEDMPVTITLGYEIDEENGDLRIVQK